MATKKYSKYPALCKYTLRKNVRDYVDFDYLDKLSEAEKRWLHQFVEEYYCGKVKKNNKKTIHNTDKMRKECYNRNNAINRDLYSICSQSKHFLGDAKYVRIVLGIEKKRNT
jgi:hypothetical protein